MHTTPISPELKDAILSHYTETYHLGDLIRINDSDVIHGVDGRTIFYLFRQFERMGLVTMKGEDYWEKTYELEVEAYDLQLRGGFYGQEVLFQKSVEDLLVEIEKAKPSLMEQADKIVSIVANLTALLASIRA